MTFIYQRKIRFQDTDAAGVVYFANVLAMCHEAYEASLAEVGIDLKHFFTGSDIAIPITHASIDFFQPLFCGDRIDIHLIPNQLSRSVFEIHYKLFPSEAIDRPMSEAHTRHICIAAATRTRQDLSDSMIHWLKQWHDPAIA